MTVRRLLGALAAAACVAATAGCSAAPELASAAPEVPVSAPGLVLDFEGLKGVVNEGTTLPSSGTAALEVRLRTAAGGKASPVPGKDGGTALRLPPYFVGPDGDGPRRAPLAALSVVPLSLAPPHPLDPAGQSFTFGASFQLDSESGGSAVDNGNNLVQRGTFSGVTQYKLQIDQRQPSCRIAGEEGALFVRSDEKVEAGLWYDVSCRRTADGIELVVVENDPLDGETERKFEKAGATGSLSAIDPTVPLAVGGKLRPSGEPMAQDSDQFNGVIDDVFLRIDG